MAKRANIYSHMEGGRPESCDGSNKHGSWHHKERGRTMLGKDGGRNAGAGLSEWVCEERRANIHATWLISMPCVSYTDSHNTPLSAVRDTMFAGNSSTLPAI